MTWISVDDSNVRIWYEIFHLHYCSLSSKSWKKNDWIHEIYVKYHRGQLILFYFWIYVIVYSYYLKKQRRTNRSGHTTLAPKPCMGLNFCVNFLIKRAFNLFVGTINNKILFLSSSLVMLFYLIFHFTFKCIYHIDI